MTSHICDINNMLWTFKCFRETDGSSPVKTWYDSLSKKAQAKFDVARDYLKQNPVNDWQRPHYAPLHGPCRGLGEIRFKMDNVQHRVLGFFGPGRMEFTLLCCDIEKGGKLSKSTCDIALKRRDTIMQHQGRAYECDF